MSRDNSAKLFGRLELLYEPLELPTNSHFPEKVQTLTSTIGFTNTFCNEEGRTAAMAKTTKKTNKTIELRRQGTGIEEPRENDCLQGRGGLANNWVG